MATTVIQNSPLILWVGLGAVKALQFMTSNRCKLGIGNAGNTIYSVRSQHSRHLVIQESWSFPRLKCTPLMMNSSTSSTLQITRFQGNSFTCN
ncbi:hypothetical protein MTO96_041909, partial [Rhipicephalus appendiculatus]